MSSPPQVTIPDIWEAFLQADKALTLKIPTYEACLQLKTNFSTYKNRIMRRDRELAHALGSFILEYKIEEIKEGKDKGKWFMSIDMKRTRARPRMEVEIMTQEPGE